MRARYVIIYNLKGVETKRVVIIVKLNSMTRQRKSQQPRGAYEL